MQPPGATITVVHTVNELQEAVRGGAVDIEIRWHLDFRALRAGPQPGEHAVVSGIDQHQVQSDPTKDPYLLVAVPPTRSIRVRSRWLMHAGKIAWSHA